MSDITQPQTMTEADWRQLGERLFGSDLSRWRFRCPTCGAVMSIEKARSFTDDEKTRLRNRWSIEQECVGRYLPGRGCDWCAYGLFSGPHFVLRGDRRTPVFGFDTSPYGEALQAAGASPPLGTTLGTARNPGDEAARTGSSNDRNDSCAKGDSNPHGVTH